MKLATTLQILVGIVASSLLLLAASGSIAATIEARQGEPIGFALATSPTGTVAVELDGIDVNRWVRVTREQWLLDAPVGPGWHRLDVFEIDDAGGVQLLASWDVEVRSSLELRESSGYGALSVEAIHRTLDHDLADPPDRTSARGAAYYEGRVAEGPWSAEIRVPLVYDSEGGRGELGRRFDPTDYRLAASLGPLSTEIGHHTAGPSSLVLQGFHRRGISVHLDSPFRTRVSTFVFRTDPFTGFRESFGLSDEDRRTLGTSLSTEALPLPMGIGDIQIAGTYLDSTGDESGAAVGTAGSTDASESSQAYAISTAGRFFEQRIELRAEYARTRYDADGSGGARPVEDSAYSFLANVNPWPNAVVLGQPFQAVFSWEEQEVGTFFRSLANPGAAVDLWTRRYGANLYWAGLGINVDWLRARDNRDDEDEQITYREDDQFVEAYYTPHWLAGSDHPKWTRWLGTPTVSARWSRFRRKPLANEKNLLFITDPFTMIGILEVAPEAYNETTRLSEIGMGSIYPRWSWNASYAKTRFDDATGIDSDRTSKLTSADLTVRPVERLDVTARFQREAIRSRDPTFKTTRYLTGLETRAVLLPDRLDTALRVDWEQTQNSDRSKDERRTLVTVYTTWLAVQPVNPWPGVAVSLMGTLEDRIDEADSSRDLDSYQIFLKVELQWAARH